MDNLFENNGANFSPDKKHRYCLWRIWDESKPKVMFIGLNPSIANETDNDRTITRCINFATTWGYGGLYMVNLFSYIATKPKDLKMTLEDDKANILFITSTFLACEKVIFAWGANKHAKLMGKVIANLFKEPYCLEINKGGSPKHPLYIKGDTEPIPYRPTLVNKYLI